MRKLAVDPRFVEVVEGFLCSWGFEVSVCMFGRLFVCEVPGVGRIGRKSGATDSSSSTFRIIDPVKPLCRTGGGLFNLVGLKVGIGGVSTISFDGENSALRLGTGGKSVLMRGLHFVKFEEDLLPREESRGQVPWLLLSAVGEELPTEIILER